MLCLMTALVGSSYAGSSDYYKTKTSNKNIKFEAVTPFYRDREVNVAVFGGRQVTHGDSWAVGVDGKYFFNRYFGLGANGYFLNANKATGSMMATATARYPIGQSRFAPYAFVGGGGIGQGSSSIHAAAQTGAGLEFRVTPNVGIMSDYSYTFIDGNNTRNFGMVRTGLNFAF